ncbi:MAG: hypothetical protein ABFR35_06945 [Thermodesulfobacteriota bacterium]
MPEGSHVLHEFFKETGNLRIPAGEKILLGMFCQFRVELKCEAHIPIDESYWDMMTHEEAHLLPDIRKLLGDRLVFVATKQRNFVDANERETVLQEMVQQVYNSMLKYLKKVHFPREFFKKQYREAHQKVLLRQAMDRRTDNC